MIEDVFNFSYMLRYIFAILFVVIIWLMTRMALKSLRSDLIYRVKPVKGFFLTDYLENSASFAGNNDFRFRETDSTIMRLPLYHTTSIGRSSACDIRFHRNDIAKRHLMIYRYDGDWFVKPVSRRNPVYLNGVRIVPATPLENSDIISAGGISLRFMDENDFGSLQYEEYNDDREESISVKGSVSSWVMINLYALLGGFLITRLIPEGLPEISSFMPVFVFSVIILINLYYFLLPLIMNGSDKFMILIMLHLIVIGMMFQIRLSGILSNGVLNASNAWLSGDQQTVAQATADLAEFSQRIMNRLRTQGLSIMIGLAIFPFAAIIVSKTRILEPLTFLCAALTPLFLIATLILGHGGDEHGATLWIAVGGMTIQLTEFAKITYLIVLAGFFKIRPSKKIQILFAVWAAAIFLLIMLLPDLGMVMILLPTTLLVYVVMTSEYISTAILMFAGSAVSVFAYTVFPHVQRRLAGWTTLWQEVNDSNRQIVYGLQAVARGGLFGRGLGNGSPGGIPLASSDMVYSIVCEELGMITGISLLAVFIILWLRSARVTVIAQDGFTSSLALGIGTMFFMEAAVVIAGVTGLIPLTGVTLPFISEGGSSMLSKIILLAILFGLSSRKDKNIRT